MPADMTESPWKETRRRQDFSETLYLTLSVTGSYGINFGPGGYYKITLNTTAGFFELPNYMNGQIPGPLIDGEPEEYCGHDCESQGYTDPIE